MCLPANQFEQVNPGTSKGLVVLGMSLRCKWTCIKVSCDRNDDVSSLPPSLALGFVTMRGVK